MSSNPDPEPAESTGLERGGGVPAGETPPDSGSGDAGPTPPGPGGRTRSPLVVLALVAVPVALLVAFFVVSAFLRL